MTIDEDLRAEAERILDLHPDVDYFSAASLSEAIATALQSVRIREREACIAVARSEFGPDGEQGDWEWDFAYNGGIEAVVIALEEYAIRSQETPK